MDRMTYNPAKCPNCGALVRLQDRSSPACVYCDAVFERPQAVQTKRPAPAGIFTYRLTDRVSRDVTTEARALLLRGERAAAVSLFVERTEHSIAEAEAEMDQLALRAESGKIRKFARPVHFVCFFVGVAVVIASVVGAAILQLIAIALLGVTLGVGVGLFGMGRVLFSLKQRGSKKGTALVRRGSFVARLSGTVDLCRLWVEVDEPDEPGLKGDALARVPAGGEAVAWERIDAFVSYRSGQPDSIVILKTKIRTG